MKLIFSLIFFYQITDLHLHIKTHRDNIVHRMRIEYYFYKTKHETSRSRKRNCQKFERVL